ncbi:hypothetical protein O181_028634 [Austropuccinia psidii MF-1]|uniref:Uncharacterized protein n=1 Tax=Austropuccinia psidii MF-1 TaxID=1389203 RepID=A0A9Q3H3T0_9BASI|nr:hypothetical protein [Austropuccinia psidii MF-1]
MVRKMRLVGFKLEESALSIMVLSILTSELDSFVRVLSHGFQNKGLGFILKKLEQDHVQFKLNEDTRETVTALYSQKNKQLCNIFKMRSHIEEYCWKKNPKKRPTNLTSRPRKKMSPQLHSNIHPLNSEGACWSIPPLK